MSIPVIQQSVEHCQVLPSGTWKDWLPDLNRLMTMSVIVLGVLIRFVGLGSKSLWFDEAVSARYLDYSIMEIVRSCADTRSAHPPLYFILLQIWSGIAGTSDFALRTPSALFGILTIVGTWAFVRELFLSPGGERRCRGKEVAEQASLLAAALVSLSPLQIQLSQQVRGYSLGAAFYVWSGWALIRAVFSSDCRRIDWIIYASLALAFCYTHNLAPLLVTTQWLWVVGLVLAQRWSRSSRAATAHISKGAALLLFTGYAVPWGYRLLAQSDTVRHGFFMPIQLQTTVNSLFLALVATFDSDPDPDAIVAWFVTGGMGLILVYLALRQRWTGLYLLVSGVAPVLIMIAFSLISQRTLLMPRYLGFTQVIWLVGIAMVIVRIPSSMGRLIMSCWVIAWAICACHANFSIIGPSANPGMREAIKYVVAHRKVNEPIISRSPFTFYGTVHYTRGLARPRLCVVEANPDSQRGAECLTKDDLVTPETLMAETLPGIWFISSNSYLTQLVVNFPLPGTWKLEETCEFEQDRYYENPVIVEHYVVNELAARRTSSAVSFTGRGGSKKDLNAH